MAISRILSSTVILLLLVSFTLEVVAQSSRRNRTHTVIKKPKVPLTDAEVYAKAKASAQENYDKMVIAYKEKYTPRLVKHLIFAAKLQFNANNNREPNTDELAAMQIEAEAEAAKQEIIDLKAHRDGMKDHLAAYATYQANVKKKQADRIAQLKADHEALRLPNSLDGMFAVMSNGAVLELVDRSDQDKHYPYKVYVQHLSSFLRQSGRKAGELLGKARYNYQTRSFNYLEALDYTKAFALDLNYQIVKQKCGTIYSRKDVTFAFQVPKGDDLASDGTVQQWQAKSSGLICPYLDMDYANCRVKRCLKQEANKMDLVFMQDINAAFNLGKAYLAQAQKTQKSYAERVAEMNKVVASINAKSRNKKKQQQRAKCPRALCDDIVINQFIIDQTWGRAPNEKPVF